MGYYGWPPPHPHSHGSWQHGCRNETQLSRVPPVLHEIVSVLQFRYNLCCFAWCQELPCIHFCQPGWLFEFLVLFFKQNDMCFIIYNCWGSRLKMATVALDSASEQTHCAQVGCHSEWEIKKHVELKIGIIITCQIVTEFWWSVLNFVS